MKRGSGLRFWNVLEGIVMPNKTLHTGQTVIEFQCDALAELMDIRNHSTVRGNPYLRKKTERVYRRLTSANAVACVVWFPRDHHGDVEEFLPPAA